jgi:general L-amino acid transport system permease protein
MIPQFEFILAHIPDLLFGFPGQRPGGLLLSLALASLSVGAGFVIALAVGSGRGSRLPIIRIMSRVHVEIFRGIPIILLLLMIYLIVGSPRFGLNLSARMAAMLALVLYSSAYQAEIIYTGLEAVPTQYAESGRTLGASPGQVFFFIKLRYALRLMLPALVGQAISLFKDTSVVVIIAVPELMSVARDLLGSNVENLVYWVSLYLVVGLIYFLVAFGISRWASRWEQAHQVDGLLHSFAN